MRRVRSSLLIALAPFVAALASTPACFPNFEVNGDGGAGANGDDGTGSDGGTKHDATTGGDDDGTGDSGNIVTLPDGAQVLQDGGPIPGDDSGPGTGGDGGPGYVPPGTFTFLFTDNQTTTATFTHAIQMDVTEVTVAQFTAWVNAGRPKPADGASLDPGGPYASAMYWESTWNTNADLEGYKAVTGTCTEGSDTFSEGFPSSSVGPTYGTTPDTLPINCVNWYQAVAYCASVGKRLATQAEFQYEATGRGHGYTYPWGDAPDPTDCSRAIWIGDGGLSGYNGCGFPVPVGSAPLGKSIDGVLDLEGSVEEWIWDAFSNTSSGPWPPDYSGRSLDAGDAISSRDVRSGSWISPKESLQGIDPGNLGMTAAYTNLGIRCVKTRL